MTKDRFRMILIHQVLPRVPKMPSKQCRRCLVYSVWIALPRAKWSSRRGEMRVLADPTAISHVCEGWTRANQRISKVEVRELKWSPIEKTNRFCSISENIDVEELEKWVANMHATDKSEKSRSLARLSAPSGSFRASIAWFDEHQERRWRRQRWEFNKKRASNTGATDKSEKSGRHSRVTLSSDSDLRAIAVFERGLKK